MEHHSGPKELTFKQAFLFPIDTPEGRRDIFVGGLLILGLLIIGWILNLGNRLNVVSRLYRDDQPYFRGFRPWVYTFKRGCISFFAIASYLSPAVLCGLLAFYFKASEQEWVHFLFALASAIFLILGVFTLPGGMTAYAVEDRLDILQNPAKAFKRAWLHRKPYLKAWIISLVAVVISFLGLFVFLIGFLFTSVWSWEVVGYVFTVAMYGDEPA